MPCTRVKLISVTVLWHFGHFWHWARKRIQCNISRYNFGKLHPIVINAAIVLSIIPALIFVLFQTEEQGVHPSDAGEGEKNKRDLETKSHSGIGRGPKTRLSCLRNRICNIGEFWFQNQTRLQEIEFSCSTQKHFHYKYLFVCLEISTLCSQTGKNIMYLTLLLKSYFLHPIITPEIYVLKIHRHIVQPIHKLKNL